ncbi:hypothetical protein [Actinomycetospora sp. CA-084318]|uniref:hypothetical protein n=1 Tax=Actinomycetospora sp. CA-084318 TaxID=3239892 RepID=UPI003D965894
MIDAIETLMRKLPAPHGKNAGVAAGIGLVFGGIGLAVYFRNIIDLILPVGIFLALAVVLGDYGVLAGAVIAAVYGYYRVIVAQEVAAENAIHQSSGV